MQDKIQYEHIIEKEARNLKLITSKDITFKKFISMFIIGFFLIPILFDFIFFKLAHNINNLSIFHIIILIISMLLPILVFAYTFIQIYSLFQTKTNIIRTKKGNQILKNSLELKNFLTDFSNLDNSTWMEVYTRGYYLIYAVVLGINKKIPKEIMKMLEH